MRCIGWLALLVVLLGPSALEGQRAPTAGGAKGDIVGHWRGPHLEVEISRDGGFYVVVAKNPAGAMNGTFTGKFKDGTLTLNAPACAEMNYLAGAGKLTWCGEELGRVANAPASPSASASAGAIPIFTAPGTINFRVTAAPASPRDDRFVAVTEAAAQRCMKFAAAHAAPRRRGGAAAAATVPPGKFLLVSFATTRDSATASELEAERTRDGFTYRKGQLGPFAFLETGEVCVGSVALVAVNLNKEEWWWTMAFATPPIGPTGVRLFGVAGDREAAQGIWVVHADSARPLTSDVLAGLPVGTEIGPEALTSSSPDGRYLVSEAWRHGVGTGVVGIDLRAGTSRFFALYQGVFDHPAQPECWGTRIPLDSARWRDGGVVEVPVRDRIADHSDTPSWVAHCGQPRDMAAVVTIDLQRGTVKRPP